MQSVQALRLPRAILVAGVTSVGLLAWAATASAASFTVTTASDSNDGGCIASLCSLRDAVVAADAAGGSSTITVPAGTYKLTIPSTGTNDPATGDLDIDNGAVVTINSAGAGATVIDANKIDRDLAVQSGASLAISGVTIENGDSSLTGASDHSTMPGYGGAIYSGAGAVSTAVASSDAYDDAEDDNAGGIEVDAGSMSISDTTIDHDCRARRLHRWSGVGLDRYRHDHRQFGRLRLRLVRQRRTG